MRWTRTLIPTLRQTPADAVVPSHQLMLRAGLIEQVAAGAYNYLPLGTRVLHKVMAIIRQEMDAAGAVEVFLPALQPIEWWEQTGRREAYGENLFVLKDRHGREQALGPTHEEVITMLVKQHVQSYKQLPLTLYQIQTKFRDEFRPRFGVLRSREFQMKDAYSFDLTVEGLDKSYDAMFDAYHRIFRRCGLKFVTVEAESGPIGGSASHEFMVMTPTGEDTILASDKGNYAANIEKCEIGNRAIPNWSRRSATFGHGSDAPPPPKGELKKVHTPNCKTIDQLCDFFKRELGTKLHKKNILKTVVFVGYGISDDVANAAAATALAEYPPALRRRIVELLGKVLDRPTARVILAVVRGDHEVNEAKLRAAVTHLHPGISKLELADEGAAQELGFSFGYIGPQNVLVAPKISTLIVDPDAAQPGFWVAGANEEPYHFTHFDWNRDVLTGLNANPEGVGLIRDIRNAVEGDPSPKNDGGVLKASKGIEVGHVFKLGYKYSEALDLPVLDEKQNRVKVIMGCYGIGVNRIIASAIESQGGHDERGIIWPRSIAPYHVVITPIKYEGPVKEAADRLYCELVDSGVEVLLDDRGERPGVMFNDADLIGIPLRITVGEKGLATGEAELKARAAEKVEMVKLEQVVGRVVAFIEG